MIKFGVVVVAAGVLGFFSFGFLALAIGTEYWYVIDVNAGNCSDSQSMAGMQSSHAGLWRIYEGPDSSLYVISVEASNHTAMEKHLLSLHRAVVILLPMNLLLLVVGGISSLYSALTNSTCLLKASAAYLLLCSLLTLSGVSIYITYSQQALAEVQRTVDEETLSRVHLSFGWSLTVACLSFSLQIASGILLLVAARIAQQLARSTNPRITLQPLEAQPSTIMSLMGTSS
ncbi:transmembrane protein 235-like [Clupea harengus]|uniref:Transmembrane protein 235-like n=1 Tax=Clupea harengus TaxID=7950 RepID=A0A6P8FMA3_CLUHA|nr:transmembrane protein 235-like [Clupea harengus]